MYFGPWAPHNVTFWGPYDKMDNGDLLSGKMYLKTAHYTRFLVILVPYIEYYTNPVGTTGVPLSKHRNSWFVAMVTCKHQFGYLTEMKKHHNFSSRTAILLKSKAIAS